MPESTDESTNDLHNIRSFSFSPEQARYLCLEYENIIIILLISFFVSIQDKERLNLRVAPLIGAQKPERTGESFSYTPNLKASDTN